LPKNPPSPGRLIALEASRSAQLRAGANHLLKRMRAPKNRRGFSLWDASAIFHELAANSSRSDPPSAKTLMILYAADLAFRLRWEIEPALAEGYTVVAAPYTRTAFRVGRAAGLSLKWLTALFEFAPQPEAAYLLEPQKMSPGSPSRPLSGFPEFSFHQMNRISPRFYTPELAASLSAGLEKDAEDGRLTRLRLRKAAD
jgi:hypothetical protein